MKNIKRIAVWSGPRNLSTALMRSFGSRNDFDIIDEPFYASYLKMTAIKHPMFDEIIKSQSSDYKEVSEYCKDNFGSLAIFQNFKNFEELKKYGSYVTEKGYIGYNFNNGPWNYVHGNNSSLSFTSDKNIYPLLSSTLLKTNSYIPQVRLDDCKNSSIIFNNPLDILLRSSIILYNRDWYKLKTIKVNTKPKNTKIIDLGDFDKSYVKIKSNMLLFRPMIFKQYQTYFDIYLH